MVSTSITGKNVARTINFDSDGDENDNNDQSDQVDDKEETSEGEDQEGEKEIENSHYENDYVLLEMEEEHKSKQSNIILEGNDLKAIKDDIDTQEIEKIAVQDYNIDEKDINHEDNGQIEKERIYREINIRIERENDPEDNVNENESEHIDEDGDCDQPSATCRFVGSGVPRETENGMKRWENGWNCFLM